MNRTGGHVIQIEEYKFIEITQYLSEPPCENRLLQELFLQGWRVATMDVAPFIG